MSQKAKRPRKPKTPPPDLVPFKIVGKLVGVRYNEHGEAYDEVVMADVTFYRSQFPKIQSLVDQAFKEEKEKAQEDQSG